MATIWAHASMLLAQTRRDPALAETLFRQGREHMAAGRNEEACEAFAESFSHDPATGTLHNLAVCHERIGKLARAWGEYSEVVNRAELANDADRQAIARAQADALWPRVPRLKLTVPAELGATKGFRLALDGRELGSAAYSAEVPVDIGIHQIHAEAEGHSSWDDTVDVSEEGERVEVAVPLLQPLTATEPAPPVAAPPATVDVRDDSPPSAEAAGLHPMKVAGYITAGVGAVGLGVGGYFGLAAIRHKRDRDDLCPDGRCSTTDDQRSASSEHQDAEDAARAANILVSIGAGLLATGVTLTLLAPKRTPKAAITRLHVATSSREARLTLSGHF